MSAKAQPVAKGAARDTVIGLFTKDQIAAWAIKVVRADPAWSIGQVYGPIPSEEIARALNLKKSKLGWFTLVGGIIGFFSGFLLAMFTASQWKLIVSGKPVIALVPFFIVGFEFTILFAVIGNVVGLIHQMQLPDFKKQPHYDPSCSGERYGVVVSCDAEETPRLTAFLRSRGAEVRVSTADNESGHDSALDPSTPLGGTV